MPSGPHLLILLLVVLVLFGTGRISGVMGDFGKGIKSFKKGLADEEEEVKPAQRIESQNAKPSSAETSNETDKQA